MSWLSGWKTRLAGVGGMITALGVLIAAMTATPIDVARVVESVVGLLGSLAVLGLGGKLQKLIDAIKEGQKQIAS